MRFVLERVELMPKVLEPGILYVSDRFELASHLCACGCGLKVQTPLGPTDWSIEESSNGPSLSPSVGNWQRPCKSDYWIRDGDVVWASQWSESEIEAGRQEEENRHRAYYNQPIKKPGLIERTLRWIRSLFKK